MLIRQHEVYEHMWWVVWDDGVRSTYPYNKARAMEFALKLAESGGQMEHMLLECP